jgi:beta-N-acetylhexosaminidase
VERLSRSRGFTSTAAARDLAGAAPGAVRAAGRVQADQLARHGLNVNLAPCVDLAINPASPIIAGLGRAFSDDPEVVARFASAWIESHTHAGVASCLKHYPGHGSSAGDSHLGFVDITETARRGEEEEPYRKLLRWLPGAPLMVMTGHLLDRTVDPDLPASLSPRHVRRLREGLGFEGVVIVDSLDMQAVTDRWGAAEAALLAVNAGADIILDAVNAPGPARGCPAMEMHGAIALALAEGRIDGGAARLERSAARINALAARLRAAPQSG